MHYLAKVCQKKLGGGASLQLLVLQTSDSLWEVLTAEKTLEIDEIVPFNEGQLILVTLNDHNQMTAVTDATDWVLGLVTQFLGQGITPEFLQQEMERAEQWRQSLTLQSQEVRRRALETAARRDEIQALEQKLRLEQEEQERDESAAAATDSSSDSD